MIQKSAPNFTLTGGLLQAQKDAAGNDLPAAAGAKLSV
jgi:hypothetical protein|tara:strand:+ start:8159 stop:8272 length:114 start_codon:yes stop_codon:yes gene_type:complete